jgi:light-regulated signal transduction histidine kinase (bacteriophytochrome)
MRVGGRTIGLLVVSRKTGLPAFADQDLTLARDLAERAALALSNARLLEQVQGQAVELEHRVVERTAQLQAANQELEAFSYSVSHDLRAPLRAIDGYVSILLEDYAAPLGEEGNRLGRVIRDEARRMGELIDDLLALSRVTRVELNKSGIDMKSLVQHVYEQLVQPDARERVDFHLGNLPRCDGDPLLLQQVWVNLIGNAVKYSSKRERAVIEVGGACDAAENVYFVRDNGAGFDMEYVGKLFGIFQRLHSEREFDGTGVGLAIVQRVIRRHGGRVWAEGEVDRGATFCFALPLGGNNHE